MDHINCLSKELRRLFLVEDIVDSIKVCETIIILLHTITGNCKSLCKHFDL